MQPPFKIYFPVALCKNLIVENKFPADYKYKAPFTVPLLQSCDMGSFLTQSISGDDYWIELWSFAVHQDGYIDLLVSEPFIFVSIMLKGDLHATSEEKETIDLIESTYNIHYLPVSSQRFVLKKGVYDLLLLIPPMYSLNGMRIEHPGIADIISRVNNKSKYPVSLESYLFSQRLSLLMRHMLYTTVKSASNSSDLQRYIPEILSLYTGQYNRLIPGFSKAATTTEKILYVRRYILTHRGNVQNCTMNEIAAQFDLIPKTLTRNFKKLTGMPVSDFARRERLQYAKQLLENEKLTELEVALKIGYSETSNFIRAFKTRYGYPPQQH